VKVALVTSLHRGGPLEHAVLLARDLLRAGVDVRAVAAGPETAERFAAAGARVAAIPLERPFDPAGAVRVHRFIRGADVVHSHDRRSGLWVRLGPRAGALRVHTIHGLPEPYLEDDRPGLRARLAYEGLERALPTDVIVTPSQAMAGLLAERLGYEGLTVIPNGVDIPPEPLPRGELVGALSLFEPVKGLDVLIDAVPNVLARRPETRFALFGSGMLEAELRARAAGLPVTFPGFVPAAEALGQLRVFVLPSRMENSPLALLEALAAGIPAVATRVGGVPEIAGPVLVPAEDPPALAAAILDALEHPPIVDRTAVPSAQRTAERMLALYEEAIRARTPRGTRSLSP
jgi:glycosyltransferase involved in cell wall biosynthesis